MRLLGTPKAHAQQQRQQQQQAPGCCRPGQAGNPFRPLFPSEKAKQEPCHAHPGDAPQGVGDQVRDVAAPCGEEILEQLEGEAGGEEQASPPPRPPVLLQCREIDAIGDEHQQVLPGIPVNPKPALCKEQDLGHRVPASPGQSAPLPIERRLAHNDPYQCRQVDPKEEPKAPLRRPWGRAAGPFAAWPFGGPGFPPRAFSGCPIRFFAGHCLRHIPVPFVVRFSFLVFKKLCPGTFSFGKRPLILHE